MKTLASCHWARAALPNCTSLLRWTLKKACESLDESKSGGGYDRATIPNFRVDALKALCEVVQVNLEELDPEPEDDDESQDDEEEEDDDAILSEDEAEQSSSPKANTDESMTKEQIVQLEADEAAQEQQQHKDLIVKVYHSLEVQFESRLQVLVHQYWQKEKKRRSWVKRQ